VEGLIIRRISYEDIQQVHEIERMSFSTPWSIESFIYEVNHKFTIFLVAVLNEEIIGYICMRTIMDVTEILNLAVHPRFRRMGVATELLKKAIHELLSRDYESKTIRLEVRESNTPAIKLYRRFGFVVIGKRKDYYHSPTEDAILMARETETTG